MIISAAVKIHLIKDKKDIIIPCHRHCDAYEILSLFQYKTSDYYVDIEGFLTDEYIFLDRRSAAEHAYECKQLIEDAETERIETLFSEDLW